MKLLALKLLVGLVLIVAMNMGIDRWARHRLQNLSPRMKLVALALIELRNVILALFLAGICYGMAISGWLTGFNELFDLQGSVPYFLLWLIDPSFLSLLCVTLVGFLLGFVTRSFGFSILLGTCLLFPSLISAPGVALLIFSEMLGQELRFFCGQEKKSALLWKFGIYLFTISCFWAGGGLIREALQVFRLNPILLSDSLLEVLLLCIVLVVFNGLLSSVIFHFYHQRTKA